MNRRDAPPLGAVGAILAAQVSIHVGAALAKGLIGELGAETLAAMRTLLAAAILLVLVRPRLSRLSRHLTVWIALYGFALGGMNLLIYEAFARLPLGVAVGVEICGPLAIALGGARGAKELAWPGLAALGLLALIPWPGRAHALDPVGLLAALGAATCWALYILLGRRAAQAGSGSAVSLGMVAACLVTFPAALASGSGALPALPVWGLALMVAVLSSALPYALEMHAMAALPARIVGLVASTTPAMAALSGYLLLGETLTAWQMLAIALLIAAAAGCTLTARSPVAKVTDDPLT
ncbi:EamA family transporter [Novosphingobium profundi]|uniref:EamA family transporter n=1 Tax=Novosphingobium profundi TaxID=1774954 RepID=UPI001CFEC00C|nr:EamA family transporter [Novosphingobium profundi]